MKRFNCLIGRHTQWSNAVKNTAEISLRLYGLGIDKLNTISRLNNKRKLEDYLSKCSVCGKTINKYAYWSGESWLMIRDYLSTHPHLKYNKKINRYTSNLWNGDPYAIELAIIQGNNP